MARTPASDGMDGVGKSGSPAPRSITHSLAAWRRWASATIAISRCCRLGDRPEPGGMRGTIAARGEVGNCEMQRYGIRDTGCGMRWSTDPSRIPHLASRIPLLPFPGAHDTILPLGAL